MPGVLVKMPPALKERIQFAAANCICSMNSEIVRRLFGSLEKENAQPAATGQALVTQ
ncbi:Arc family DNA-binding protein [Burkholderia sp. Bmkn7]|uniref:Arc family DNA-binding protein n=1 Tax=Burkholderia TaxID=32008 RepID=UPI000DCFD8C3|nr:Arc family DNA-binding protein [Burkholderia cepacia]MBW5804806.1 Arc family DNA-binding protein [Burkholderia sp. COPS]